MESPLTTVILAQVGTPETGGLLEQFGQAGPMAKIVLGMLIGLSLGSWAITIGKIMQYRKASDATQRFLEIFRRSKRFSEVSHAADGLRASPLVGLFKAGYVEIDAQIKAFRKTQDREEREFRIKSLQGIGRSLQRATGVEMMVLSRGTGFLATTAASAPFIGLFGTVWGIMIAFRDIGLTGSTSLVAVAPGLSEALINTAAGLAVAIPALMAYNFFAFRLRRYRAEMDDFVLEFMNLAERNFT